MHILLIYYTIYVVLFAWLFSYKSPEICHVFFFFFFCQVSLLMICYYVAVLTPANRYITDRGF